MFDNQRVIIKDCDLDLGQVLARDAREGGLCRLFIDLIKHGALAHDNPIKKITHI
jgi:hypothetical protein